MSAITLYEIAVEFRQMVDALTATDNDEQTIADTIEAESYPLELKAQNVGYAIKTLLANADAIEAAEHAMYARRVAMQNRAAAIKQYLMECMLVAGVQKIECPHFTIRIVNNAEKVAIDDARQIPAAFLRTYETPPPEPDKKAIKAALTKGQDVPGARLIREKRVDIK
jgi:hypothetical protein